MTRCPDGHDSSTADYCDVCGMPMSAPSASPPPATPPPTNRPAPAHAPTPTDAPTQTCPHCSAVNAEDNLFCEVCGFDFTTGVMPRVEGGAPSFLPPVVVPKSTDDADDHGKGDSGKGDGGTEGGLDDGGDDGGDDGEVGGESDGTGAQDASVAGRGAEHAPAPDSAETRPDAAGEDSGGSVDYETPAATPDPDPSPQRTEARPTSAGESAAATAASAPDPVRTAPKPLNRPPSREVVGDWVVEVWIDPDWYAVQDTDEPCPSPAPPEIVRITGSDALVGRRSRTSVPDVDCGVDSAVSRRQALLTSDGRRWWIEDLDSANGTWVGPAIGPLPTSPTTSRTEIDADDRIYVGAWTRLVLRPATESEVAAGTTR